MALEPIWVKNYPAGVPGDLTYQPQSLNTLLENAARDYPNRTAVDFQGVTLTYKQLAEQVDKMASVLRDLGVKKGDRVGTVTPNIPQMVIAYYATLRLGAIAVCNNPLYTERELEHQINDAGITVLLVMDLMYDKIKAIRSKCPTVQHVIVTSVFDVFHGLKAFLGPKLKKDLWKAIPAGEPVKRYKQLMASARGGTQAAQIDPVTDLALLQYTGGTTGVSKGVMLSHANLSSNCKQAEIFFRDLKVGQETILVALPLFHSYGQTMAMNVGVMLASTLVLVPNPRDLKGLLETINRTKPTVFPGVPTLYANLLTHPDLAKTDMSSIRLCGSGAAPLPLEVQEKWEKVTGGKLVEGYGLSETSPLSHMNPPYGTRKSGTIGIPVPGTDCKLVDVDDPTKEIDIPGPGELCIRGPQVMGGYWHKEDESAQVLIDGWLHTGDVCEVDADGFFKIVDRKKDMIIVGGFNVYPRDIEEVLYQHPKVLEAAVAGIPDPRSGEIVKAYLVPKPGESITTEEIDAFVRERLTGYKVPRAYEIRAELPKTMVGKILRRALVEEEKAKLAK